MCSLNRITSLMILGLLFLAAPVAFAADRDKDLFRPAEPKKAPEPAQGKLDVKSKIKLQGGAAIEVRAAQDLLYRRDYAEAAARYRDIINKDPRNAGARAGYGLALGKQFKIGAAEEQLAKALELDPNNAIAHVGKGMLDINKLQTSNVTILKQRESILKDAETECREALKFDPACPDAHYYLAQALKEQGQLDEAANEYREAIRVDDKLSEAFSGLGMVNLKQGNTNDAESNFRQAVTLKSGNGTAHYGLGKTYLTEGKLDDAVKELNTALSLNQNSAPTHLAMGEVLAGQGNSVAAMREFKEAVRIKPEMVDPYLHIADIFEGRGDTEISISELRTGLELLPDNPELHLRIGDNSLRLEKLDDAIKEYDWVMTNAQQSAAPAAKGLTRAYYLKSTKDAAGAFLASNEFEEAKHMLEKAIALSPNDMELRLAQAKLASLSGETIDLKSVGTPTSDGERIAYAEALLAQNNFKQAQEQMEQVIKTATDAKQTFAVADVALMIKDLDSAEAAYKKGAEFPGGEARAKRGLGMVAKVRKTAAQECTLASDLEKRKQLASAIDKYHASIYDNPKAGDVRLSLAKTLEELKPPLPCDLREAVTQYKAYLELSPPLAEKDLEKLQKHLASLEQRASKMDKSGNKTSNKGSNKTSSKSSSKKSKSSKNKDKPADESADAKPVEATPVETKPVETKPAETKPAETKPVEPASN